MKLSVEVTVPEYTTILSIDESARMTDGTHEVLIPESKQTVEINLDDLDLDSLEEYVQIESESTLVADDRLEFIEEFEYIFNDRKAHNVVLNFYNDGDLAHLNSRIDRFVDDNIGQFKGTSKLNFNPEIVF